MGILIFTLLAVAFGCGMGSKARKDRKQREKRLQQGSIPAGKPLFSPAAMPFEPEKSAEFPLEPAETVSDAFWEVPEDSLERIEPESDTDVSAPEILSEALPEPPKPPKAEPASPTEKKGFSLREAVIAQTVLERKYH